MMRRVNPDFGTRVSASANGRLELRKIADKRTPWIVFDPVERQRIYFSGTKSKAESMLARLAREERYLTDAERTYAENLRARATRMQEGAKEHARQVAAGEVVRGPVIAGVQMWEKRNPATHVALRVPSRVIRSPSAHGYASIGKQLGATLVRDLAYWSAGAGATAKLWPVLKAAGQPHKLPASEVPMGDFRAVEIVYENFVRPHLHPSAEGFVRGELGHYFNLENPSRGSVPRARTPRKNPTSRDIAKRYPAGTVLRLFVRGSTAIGTWRTDGSLLRAVDVPNTPVGYTFSEWLNMVWTRRGNSVPADMSSFITRAEPVM